MNRTCYPAASFHHAVSIILGEFDSMESAYTVTACYGAYALQILSRYRDCPEYPRYNAHPVHTVSTAGEAAYIVEFLDPNENRHSASIAVLSVPDDQVSVFCLIHR